MNFLRRLFGFGDPEPATDEIARRAEDLLADYRRKKADIAASLGVTVEEYDAAITDAGDTITLASLPDGDDPHDIVGEANYQDALANIAGPKPPQGVSEWITAELVPEPDNPHDSNAVVVLIDGEKVGYLSRKDAPALRRLLQSLGAERAECDGIIEGGWKRDGSEGSYCVRLDIEWPPRAAD